MNLSKQIRHFLLRQHYYLPKKVRAIWCVDGTTGNDANVGHSPEDAFLTIGAAINAAADGDLIKVAEDTYDEAVSVPAGLPGLEIICEPGTILINTAVATGVAIAAPHVKLEGCLITQAGAIGLAVTGAFFKGKNIIVDGCTVGFDIDGANPQLKNCISKNHTVSGFDIAEDSGVYIKCFAIGTAAVTGFNLSHTNAEFNIFLDCHSLNNTANGFNLIVGADSNTIINCSQSSLCGGPADAAANNSWINWSLESVITAGQSIQEDLGDLNTAIAAIKAIVDVPANFMADVTALALEATLTAIKGAGFATGTDSLKILSDVLDTITAAGPTNVQMNAARDAILAAIPAMRGTDGAATVAAGWDAALATILDNFTAGRITNLDELAAANLPADITALATAQGAMLFTMDFWSLPQEEVALLIGVGDKGLPSVTVADLPGDATIVRAIAMFKFRMVENHTFAGPNSLDGAQVIQVAGSVPAINFVAGQFTIAETTREGGDVVIGLIDIAATVNANGAYAFHWDDAKALQTGINFNDVQMGIRIWYSV